MRISISELIDTVKEIDAKTNYIENIQDDILALSEKLYPKDPDEWMSNV